MKKNKKISFSVLLSVYVKEKASNLDKSLDSLFCQTLLPDEIILVEDGPITEELDCVIKKYMNKYDFLRIVKIEKNGGLGNALNFGLQHCTYDYVARMDTDDIAVCDRFQKQVEFFMNNPEIDVVGGNIIEFDDATGKDISLKQVPKNHSDIFKYAKKRNPINHMTVMFKKESVIKSGSYLDCLYFEDYYLWVRMLKNGMKFHNLQSVLVKARGGLDLSNRRGNLKYLKCIINFQNKILKIHYINVFQYVRNIVIRIFFAILPNNLRYQLYQKKLRKSLQGDQYGK